MNDRFAIYENLKTRQTSVAVIGLGYVGWPVAEAFACHFDVVAYDISQERINHIKSSSPVKYDTLHFTSDANDLDKASLYIITVGTPVDELKRPDLSQLISQDICTVATTWCMNRQCILDARIRSVYRYWRNYPALSAGPISRSDILPSG